MPKTGLDDFLLTNDVAALHALIIDPDDRPRLHARESRIDQLANDAWDVLLDAEGLYFRLAGKVVELEINQAGDVTIWPIDENSLTYALAERIDFYVTKQIRRQGTQVDVQPPARLAKIMLGYARSVPILERVTSVPVLDGEGRLMQTPGYTPSMATYYVPAVTIPAVADTPTDEDVARATALIDEVLAEFPFAAPADKAHAFALGLEPFIRRMIDGSTPVHLYEAPTQGTGKGLLVNVLLRPSLGTWVPFRPGPENDAECRKAITAKLMSAASVFAIDNLVQPLDYASMAAATTNPVWEDRLLGQNAVLTGEITWSWVVTANNPIIGDDFVRRCLRTRVEANVEKPAERTFTIPNLKAHVAEHEGELAWAFLTLCRAWVSRGAQPWTARTFGSFESWASVIGGVLATAGIPGFLENMAEFQSVADSEAGAWRTLTEAWWATFGTSEVTTAKLLLLVTDHSIELHLKGDDDRALVQSLGNRLVRQRGKVYGDLKIERNVRTRGWVLIPLSGTRPPTGSAASAASAASTVISTREKGRSENTGGVTEAAEAAEAAEHQADSAPSAHSTSTNGHSTSASSGGTPGGETPWEPCEPCEPIEPLASRARETPNTHMACVPAIAYTVGANGSQASQGSHVALLPFTRIRSNDDLTAILPDLHAAEVLGLDVETAGPVVESAGVDAKTAALNPRIGRLCVVSIAIPEQVYVIDPTAADLSHLTPLLAGETGPLLIGHNLSFDLAFLQAAGLPLPEGSRIFDSMIASQLINGGKKVPKGFHSLGEVAQRWLGPTLDKTLQTSDWGGVLSDEQLDYAAQDAAILHPLHDVLTTALAKDGLTQVAALEFAALPAVVWMESTGVPIDVDAWTALRETVATELAAADAELATLLPGLNPNSSVQIRKALADLGIRIADTQKATLLGVVDRHPAVEALLRHRAVKTRDSTYGDSFLKHVHPVTRRLHADFNQLGAASGRMSCSKPNLQNIPRSGGYRSCVRPPAGRMLVKADFSQIELRIAAQVAGDREMLAAFRAGEDLHAKTARAVLGREPTKDDRQLAKALNFGLIYGAGVPRLRASAWDDYGVMLSERDAERFRERFFQTYPGLRAWHRAQPDGEVTTCTLSGRPRHGVSQFTQKLNSPVQGSGADILKLAMARLWSDRAAVPSAALILVVHDEVICEVDVEEAEVCRDWLVAHMEAAGRTLLTEVPVVVDAAIVADWGGTPVKGLSPETV